MTLINILKISLILIVVFINVCNTFEYRYIPNSEEYDKKLMLNSIYNTKTNNRFVSRFDLNKLKNRRWDYNYNDNNYNNNQNIIKPNINIQPDKFKNIVNNNNNQTEILLENDIIQQNETIIQQIDNSVNNLTNQVIISSTNIPHIGSALSYDPQNISQHIYQQKPLNFNNIEFNNNNNSNSINKLPIYFTNPLTGIVYSITEVGHNYTEPIIINSNNNSNNNDTNSIPIYIPKEQYDRDMNLLKLEFMKQCRIGKNQKNHTKLINTTITNGSKILKLPNKSQILQSSGKKHKNKNKKQPIKINNDDDEDDISSSSSFDGVIDNVFDEIVNVIDDSSDGSSSEEHNIKIPIKLKTKNHNEKINIKKKIKIKPISTRQIIKKNNVNQTISKFLTQVEKPINKTTIIPFYGHTTIQSFVNLIPLRKPNIKNSDSTFSSSKIKIAKRSIDHRRRAKSTLPTIFHPYNKSIRKIKPNRRTTTSSTNFITEIPIVKYTTPSMEEFYLENHRISKRSLESKHQFTTENTGKITNTIPIEIKSTKSRIRKKKLKKVKKKIIPLMITTISTPLSEHFTETPRVQQTIPTYIHYREKEMLKILSTQNPITTPTSTTTTLMPGAVTSLPFNKLKNRKTEYDDDYDEDDDYFINYDDIPFGDDFDKKDENNSNSKDDEEDEDDDEDEDYSVENSSESEEYSGNSLSKINNKQPQQVHQPEIYIEKKAKRKRKPSDDDDEDYYNYDNDDDDDYSDGDGVDIMKFMKVFFYPAHSIWTNLMTNTGDLTNNNSNDRIDEDYEDVEEQQSYTNNEKRKPKYPKYTVYKNKLSNTEEEDSSSSWFTSWFSGSDDNASNNNDNKNNLTNINPSEEPPGWFDNWFGYNERSSTTPPTSTEDYDEDDGFLPDWFSNWFDSSTKKNTKTHSTTTTPTTPLLTISNPMKNPQKWIGILAQHIVNSTVTPNSITSPQFEDDEPELMTYDKYQIWRLKPFGENQVKALEKYKNSVEGSKLQWLQGPTLRGLTDVLVPPKLRTDFQGTLNFEDIVHEVLIFDVGKAIYYETKDNTLTDTNRNPFAWKKYQTYDKIIRFIETLQVRNPNFIELFHIGRSYEGRPLVIVKISIKDPLGRKKLKLQQKNNNRHNGVFIEAGLHGREWITPASATWIINNLVKIMKSNQTTSDTEYIKKMTWFIMPILNPDGYEYSHEYDRMWYKSRSKHLVKTNGLLNTAINWFQQNQEKSEKICFGVDLNENWNYEWGKDNNIKSPCNEFYSGPNSFSEPETKSLSKFLMDHRKKIKLFISLQSYGQIISYPNKLNTSFSSQKMDDLLDVAMVGNDALRKSGSNSRYKIDSTNDLVTVRSGSSTYFAMYEAGIPFSYTIHLGDNGVHGYLLPSSNIESTAKDAFQIIKAMVDYI